MQQLLCSNKLLVQVSAIARPFHPHRSGLPLTVTTYLEPSILQNFLESPDSGESTFLSQKHPESSNTWTAWLFHHLTFHYRDRGTQVGSPWSKRITSHFWETTLTNQSSILDGYTTFSWTVHLLYLDYLSSNIDSKWLLLQGPRNSPWSSRCHDCLAPP